MKILGVTGGIGSGKSQILHYLQKSYGAVISPLDDVARQLQRKGQHCFERIVENFGQEMIGNDGELNREKLAAAVFSNSEKLVLLNNIVHPEVKQWVRQDISQKQKENIRLYVVESALFPDVDYGDICEEMWYIYAGESIRCRRLRESRGYTEGKIREIIQAQPSEDAFRKICTAVIDNSGDFENTKRQIGELLL